VVRGSVQGPGRRFFWMFDGWKGSDDDDVGELKKNQK